MFRKVVEVNVVGAFHGLKCVSAAMTDSGGGVIVNTASLAGMVGPRYMAAYAASKHAVIGLTKTAAKDLAPFGVRVCAVSPGLLEGRMWGSQVEGKARCDVLVATGENRNASENEKKETEKCLLAGTPLGRLGRLSEVAQAVLFLCSDDASYLTGTVLAVDGGRLP
jgi:NAD(P)-dependent dehydrogenase (short-subunit alcohol dehydrogenase family)